MSRWFRMYDELLHDPKVQRLSPDDFRSWVNLLCLASSNEGRLPCFADIGFALRMTADAVSTVVERLSSGGLIDRVSGGLDGYHYAPHGWSKRQFKSDTSTERVKRYRQRSRSVAETPPDTETDTVAKATAPEPISAAEDPAKSLFDRGVALLVSKGKTEPAARAIIAKFQRDYGDAAVLDAIERCRGATDPVSAMRARLGRAKAQAEYFGP